MKQRLVEIIKKVLTEQPKKDCDCGCNKCHKAPLLNESKQYSMPISENMRYHLDKQMSIHDNIFRPGSKAHIDLIHEARLLWKKGVIELRGKDKILFETTDLGRFGIYEGEVVPLDYPMMELLTEAEFNINKVWDFIESKPFYNKEYMPVFSTAKEIWDKLKPEQKELYNSFEWKDTYGGKIHPREKEVLRRRANLTEAEYQGRKVQLGKPMQGDSKKFKVYVKNAKGKVVKVNFGFGGKSAKGKRMVIKDKNPKRRAAFRARHNCKNPGPRWKARYWSCKKW